MNPIVLTSIGQADPNASPVTVNDLISLLNQLISTEIQGSYIPYVIQHDTPGVDDRDKAWIELDPGGRPTALKVWYPGNQGAWRRVYNGMIGEVRGYTGDPSIDFDMDGNNPGRGKIGLSYDGWYLCNGFNGTPNLSDKFILGGHMDNSAGHTGYHNGWQASVKGPNGDTTDLKTGGFFTQPILPANLPPFDVNLNGKEYKDGTDHDPDFFPILDTHYANLTDHTINLGHYGSDPTAPVPVPQSDIWTTPPFIVMGLITFKGY